jgi:hypothetical protein
VFRAKQMKEIEIPYWTEISKNVDTGIISGFLDELKFSKIDTESWPEYSYKPSITFAMAHSGDCIFINSRCLKNTHRPRIGRTTHL